jgi:gliding motility-associated-like protein
MDPSGNCLYFTWFPTVGLSNPNASNPIATPLVNTRYYVTATTEAGCKATDSIYVLVHDESALNMPNAFSPGSNPNPEFKVLHLGTATLKSFRVYNRWGNKVFETSNIEQGWNGQYNGAPQPMGVYVYSVEAVTNTGKTFTRQGNVTLIR